MVKCEKWSDNIIEDNPERIIIVSGHFLLLHEGHYDYIDGAAKLGKVLVIINNDDQIKQKGNLPLFSTEFRIRQLESMKNVWKVIVSIDQDRTVCKTLEMIRSKYPYTIIMFGNGGDVTLHNHSTEESQVCEKHNIYEVFGVGGNKKDSSSSVKDRIFKEMYEKYQKTEGLIAFL